MTLYTPKSPKDLPKPLTINESDPIQTVLDLKYFKEIRNFSYLTETFDEEDEEFDEVDKSDPAPYYLRRMNKLCMFENSSLEIMLCHNHRTWSL